MADIPQFRTHDLFPGSSCEGHPWLSGFIPKGDAKSMRKIMRDLCSGLPPSGPPSIGGVRLTDCPGVYVWVFDTGDRGEKRFRPFHIGQSVASMRARTCCHIKNAYVGIDSAWELDRKGAIGNTRFPPLEEDKRPRSGEDQRSVADVLNKVRVLFIAIPEGKSCPDAGTLIKQLEGSLIRAAYEHFEKLYEGQGSISNLVGKSPPEPSDNDRVAWRQVESILTAYADV